MRIKVVAKSSNQNSFGLWGMVWMTEGGRAWQTAGNDLNVKEQDTIINVSDRGRWDDQIIEDRFRQMGFELVERLLPDPSPQLLAQVWTDAA